MRLKADIASLYGTIEGQRDLDRLVDFTHPKALEKAGGRDKFKEVIKQGLDDAESNFKSLEWTIDDSIQITEHDGQLFASVPRTLNGVTVSNKTIVQQGMIVGISGDAGKTWKFINGTGFDSTFPEYAEAISIPKLKTFIDGIEQ